MKDFHFVCEIKKEHTAMILNLEGYLDLAHTGTFDAKLQEMCQANSPCCILDFSKLLTISNASLGILITRVQELRKHGGDVCIGGCSPHVEQVLETFGFKNFIPFFSTRKAAMERYAVAARN